MSIRVRLFDGTASVNIVEFHEVPLEDPANYHCQPEGCLSFPLAREISLELKRGEVKGWISGIPWYRQAGGRLP